MAAVPPTAGANTYMTIPSAVQIDAILADKMWNLVLRYCGGAWGALPGKWTVSFEQIAEEAKRRGLESFISAKPINEGYWLLESDGGYVVFYFERGVRAYAQSFAQLEPAFRCWLENELQSFQLPVN